MRPRSAEPRFVTGSPLRHVVVMSGTGAIGLISVFAVDLANLFYISLLGQASVAAAVGFAGVIIFFQVSICIGLTIGVSASVSRMIGTGQRGAARRVASASLCMMAALALVVGLATVLLLDPFLSRLGAAGETFRLAKMYLTLTSPTLPLLAVGMGCAALMRSVGDARRAMNVTLSAAIATAMLDPLLIFGLHLSLMGAAIASIGSRLLLAGVGWYGAARVNHLLGRVAWRTLPADLRPVLGVALPAVLTNLATPVGSAYTTHTMAVFGAAAVAGQATIDRISPVAFGIIYALTGAVGPILAQNLGAGRPDRVRQTLRASLLFVLASVLAAWLLLALAQGLIVRAFSAHGLAEIEVRLFCNWLAGSFVFAGCLFVANSVFNNLGFPLLSTTFNWGRATLGTIPFVYFGARFGPQGILIGQALGSVLFGLAAVAVAFRVVRLAPEDGASAQPGAPPGIPAESGRGALAASLVTSVTTFIRGGPKR